MPHAEYKVVRPISWRFAGCVGSTIRITFVSNMKAFIFALFAVALSVNLRDAAFLQYQKDFNKYYSSVEEERYRLAVYKSNLKKIELHNAQHLPWTMGVNEFADMTEDEFGFKFCGCAKDPKTRAARSTPIYGDAPERVDWREQGAVTPVKDQASCGSCWSFSTTGTVEGAYFVHSGKLVSLSEQQLVDCATEPEYKARGCSGGWPWSVLGYVQKKGLCTEEDYPYHAKDEDCKDDKCEAAIHIKGYEEVEAMSGAALKAAVSKAPVSVAVEADSAVFQMYTGGIVDDSACGTSLNHGVLAVGYGENYWIVKNSWGASWGDKGYIKIAYKETGAGICGINQMNSYPTF